VDEDQGLTAVQFAKRGIGMRGMTLLTNFSFAKKFMKEGGGGNTCADLYARYLKWGAR
jgi:hypothetical protein